MLITPPLPSPSVAKPAPRPLPFPGSFCSTPALPCLLGLLRLTQTCPLPHFLHETVAKAFCILLKCRHPPLGCPGSDPGTRF
jgi:hypothetical protein